MRLHDSYNDLMIAGDDSQTAAAVTHDTDTIVLGFVDVTTGCARAFVLDQVVWCHDTLSNCEAFLCQSLGVIVAVITCGLGHL